MLFLIGLTGALLTPGMLVDSLTRLHAARDVDGLDAGYEWLRFAGLVAILPAWPLLAYGTGGSVLLAVCLALPGFLCLRCALLYPDACDTDVWNGPNATVTGA